MKDIDRFFGSLDLDEYAFFFDFDGTLAEIAPRPQDVELPPAMTRNLLRLSARTHGAVAIITGRNRAEIHPHLDHEIPVAGLHGTDFPQPDPAEADRAAHRIAAMRPLIAHFAGLLDKHPGALIEDKGQGIALHWRGAPAAENDLRKAAQQALAGLGPDWQLQPGKCVVEIRPAGEDKGTALRRFMARAPFAGRRPLAFGDDLNDQPMLDAARNAGGLAIALGERALAADLRLPGPAALADWLERRLGA